MHDRSTSLRRTIAVAAAIVAVSVGYQDVPRAQSPALNAKQRWLAGELLPIDAVANARARRATLEREPRQRFVPGRVLVKLADGVTESSLSGFSPGAATVHVSAEGGPQWLRTPPPLVREVEVQLVRNKL